MEAATADLNDVNMIDPFHLEEYGKSNYNRDVEEIFPGFKRYVRAFRYSPINLRRIAGRKWQAFALQMMKPSNLQRARIIRRYYAALCDRRKGIVQEDPAIRRLAYGAGRNEHIG